VFVIFVSGNNNVNRNDDNIRIRSENKSSILTRSAKRVSKETHDGSTRAPRERDVIRLSIACIINLTFRTRNARSV